MLEEKGRCIWCLSSELYKKYHDKEWGVPVYDDATFYEFLLLETFQAGLSWITILNKRKNFQKAFDNFEYQIIANYNDDKILNLLEDAGIIRNKLKVYSAVTNAQNFIKIQSEFGSFSEYIWAFVDGKPIINRPKTMKDVRATTELSDKISKDLKKRGFKFVGSMVMYAFMQATGIVNDHVVGCWKTNQ
ncbi:MAG: DNA-3-methyladenine glycosylase I [Flavobacterium sp.]|nr:DNA-3-methyladenine glycosylase I [Flavobacterium sp.]